MEKRFHELEADAILCWFSAPKELLTIAQNEPFRFLRDCASLPTIASSPFIINYDMLEVSHNRGLVNPFNMDIEQLDKYWRCSFKENFNRYIHVDLGQKKDCATIAMCHAPTFVERVIEDKKVYLPIIQFDVLIRIKPPQGGEIRHASIVEFIEDFSRRGYNIRLITFDKFQSTSPIEILREQNYICEVLSIDRMTYWVKIDRESNYNIKHVSTLQDYSHGYYVFKDALLDNRLNIPHCPQYVKEAKLIEYDAVAGLVYTPEKEEDDLIQAMIGAATNLWHNEKFVEISNEFVATPEVLHNINREKSFDRRLSGDSFGNEMIDDSARDSF